MSWPSAEAQGRMAAHGYCRNLAQVAGGRGGEVLTHELFSLSVNPLNTTALTVICKPEAPPAPQEILACPRFKTPLEEIGNMLYSPEALVAYPVMGEIPCLRIENGILAGKFKEVMVGVSG